jgi:hypothetical protein
MTIRIDTSEFGASNSLEKAQVLGGSGYDWSMIAVCTWLVLGIFADAWAHNHLPIDNFFTPWHGLLYSGLLAVGIFLMGTFIRNRRRGYPVSQAMPRGYELSLLGFLLFLASGIADMFWHILFGIELNIDGALSPTHLGIVISAVLVVSGPFRAAWHRSYAGSTWSLIPLLPMLLSLAFMLSVVTVIAQIAHPFVFLWPSYPQQDSYDKQVLAVVSIALQSIILMIFVLLSVRRWTLPFGAFTLIFTLNITLLSFMQDHYFLILVAALAGLITDLLIWRLKPSVTQPGALRLFAFAVPTVLYLLYFLALTLTTGVNWTIHLWLGSTVVAGITGYALSYLLVPPMMPGEQGE